MIQDEKKSGNQSEELSSMNDELFRLEIYPIIDEEKIVILEVKFPSPQKRREYRKLLSSYVISLIKARLALEQAYLTKDWKKILFLADRERDGALYVGAVRLTYACLFIERYYETKQTALLDALYEQLFNTIEETKIAFVDFITKNFGAVKSPKGAS